MEVRYGGGDEPGLLCGCGKRVSSPFCPWCGLRMADAPEQLALYLRRNIEQNLKSAEGKLKQAEDMKRRGDDYCRNLATTAERLRERAKQQQGWLDWVLAHKECGRTVAEPGKVAP